jgi:hypothetical protein
MVEWKDVTSDYAGLFFRAEGGGSEAFGSTQDENAPRVVEVQNVEKHCPYSDTKLDTGVWSGLIYVGDLGSEKADTCLGLKFLVSSGEVRPRNKAMRIWERIK